MTTIEEMRKLITYDPKTGGFFNELGQPLKTAKNNGGDLCLILSDGRRVVAARAAWILSHDAAPVGPVQFIDGDRYNLKLDNLLALSSFKDPKDSPAAVAKSLGCLSLADVARRASMPYATLVSQFAHKRGEFRKTCLKYPKPAERETKKEDL